MAISGLANSDQKYDGSSLKIAILHARWNKNIIDALVSGAVKTMQSLGVKEQNIHIESVPGSYELPFAASRLVAKAEARGVHYDAIIPIGVLIKGDSMHFEYICEAVSRALMELQFKINIPVIFGILTCLSEKQALIRSGLFPVASGHNHGEDFGAVAVEMAVKFGH
ncbi:lumazine synthase RIB4 Ecym_2009 [Eremothecium cymbalariae DBVPG|uniref:6,7-dimethyl-8-ribityllumazine synthase n=1 Tax=Eremothecium cymbalariae (strain CBS 270.75 / DBVPG 7215 / KCTC 17166 / NRRL Y-17582) TaxID=931890 RepID=G8JNF9_ERECY|nr:Hypothetical protein Ecym_2009 [Eremothecium cymbalariae DBVPG\